jgi:hypothetical protein
MERPARRIAALDEDLLVANGERKVDERHTEPSQASVAVKDFSNFSQTKLVEGPAVEAGGAGCTL